MRTGVPGMAYARPAHEALGSALSSAGRERHGALGALQVTVLDGYPYYVVKDPDVQDGEIWFDALTGGMITGPHQGGT